MERVACDEIVTVSELTAQKIIGEIIGHPEIVLFSIVHVAKHDLAGFGLSSRRR